MHFHPLPNMCGAKKKNCKFKEDRKNSVKGAQQS